ncbi:threonine/serine exporter family protein [uncultured Oscillibacter sp.]|uniref:threonine/serine exporter family protein n=1 Tax=uncultured Oscillibacter sp. TaxID=876091 RepID=UPI0025E03B2E|nr:threonine/serine exporter family protein [uncultured Oscillibacter sp.]
MDIWSQYVLPCLCAFAGCIGFTLVFNIHGPGKLIAGCGGALGWLVYLLAGKTILAGFFAAMAISLFSEVMARIRRCPVTGYQLVALLPLVPGGGIYYTMEHAMSGETSLFLESLLHTLGLAGALAVGVLMVASLARLVTNYQNHRRSLPGGKQP